MTPALPQTNSDTSSGRKANSEPMPSPFHLMPLANAG